MPLSHCRLDRNYNVNKYIITRPAAFDLVEQAFIGMEPKLKYCESDKSPLGNSRGSTRSLAFSSNGLWLAGAVNNYAVIWNVETGREFFSIDGQRGNEARSVFWLADCATVYCAFSNGWIYTIHLDGTVSCSLISVSV